MERTVISKHDSPLGQWTRALYFPKPPLAAHVEMLWYVSGHTQFERDRRLPTGKAHLIFSLGDSQLLFERGAPAVASEFRTCWVAGQQRGFIETGSSGHAILVGVQFHAHGAYRLLGIPQHELSDRVIELNAVLGDRVLNLRQRLVEAQTPEECFALLEYWLLGLIERGAPVHPAVRAVSATIIRESAPIRLAQLSRVAGMSPEHLIRKFREQVGLTPQAYAKVLRFNRARSLARSNRIAWREIAQTCGYYDQSHLVRDFQRYAGRAPSSLLSDQMPDADSIVIS